MKRRVGAVGFAAFAAVLTAACSTSSSTGAKRDVPGGVASSSAATGKRLSHAAVELYIEKQFNVPMTECNDGQDLPLTRDGAQFHCENAQAKYVVTIVNAKQGTYRVAFPGGGTPSPSSSITSGSPKVRYGDSSVVTGDDGAAVITITRPKLITGIDSNGARIAANTYQSEVTVKCTRGSINIYVDQEIVAHSTAGDSYPGNGFVQDGLPDATLTRDEVRRGRVQFRVTRDAISSVVFQGPLSEATLATWT